MGGDGLKRSWVRAFAALLIAALLVSFAPALPAAEAAPPPKTGNRILVLHDSVVNSARQEIIDSFPNRRLEFVGFGGLRVSGAIELLEEHPDLITSDVIVELGTNYGNKPNKFRRDLNKLMKMLDKAQHVLWLQPSEFRTGIAQPRNIIRRAAHRYPNLHVVDWGAETASNQHYTREDGIHLEGDGPHALGRFMSQHLNGAIPWNRIPEGSLEPLRVNKVDLRAKDRAPRVRVKGWAYDPDESSNASLRITVGGTLIRAAQPTNIGRPVLASSLDHGNTMIGFDRIIRLKRGKHRLCVSVDNNDGLPPVKVGCRTVRV